MKDVNENKKGPLVSVGVPCYNHEKYLDDFFSSLLDQSYENIELIIIDDYSTDGSCDKINSYLSILRDRNIRVDFHKHNRNMGISRTCNDIIRRCNGKYIKMFSSDDVMLPECISEFTDYMEKNPEANILIGNLSVVNNDYTYGSPYEAIRNMDIDHIKNIRNIHEELFNSCFINSPGMFVREGLFEKYNYYDEELGFEDWDFLIRVSKNEKIHFIDEILLLYRKSATSISNYMIADKSIEKEKKFARMYLGTRDLFRKHRGELPEDKWKECFGKRYTIFLNDADKLNLKKYIDIIFRDMKKDGIDIYSFRQKQAYWIKNHFPNLFKVIKKIT